MDRLNMSVKLPNSVSNTSYNQANQQLSFNDKAMTYDENGNMSSMTNSCGVTTYTWNSRNQLVGIDGFDDNCQPVTAFFKYDALGRRSEKTINGKTINYLYDGLDIVQEIENGTVTVNYIRTLNIDEPLARIKSDTIRYYQQDALGSVIALTDETGTIKTQYNYAPFGNVTITGEQSDNPFQFAGRENDGTGLLFERARYYSFELLRYISQDPIGFAGGDVNWYVRVGNNVINRIDPLGLDDLSELEPEGRITSQLDECLLKCVSDQLGITTLIGAGGVGLGTPILPAGGKPNGATRGTSIASKGLSNLFPQKIPSTWAPTLKNPLAKSAMLGRVLGRWVPIVGWGLLAYDLIKIGQCVDKCMNENDCK